MLPEELQHEDREDRALLRQLEVRLGSLLDRRRDLIAEMRRVSAEQKSLYDRRQAPQAEVERLYDEHGQLGRQLSELRSARDLARRLVEVAVVHRRELLLTFDRRERERPDQIRREIAQLELHQQTRALPLEEENALIARLRHRSQDLKDAEARIATVAEHERLRREAEGTITESRNEVDRLGAEMRRVRLERDAKMEELRARLQSAGGLIAELRAKGKARSELMTQIDQIGREIVDLEREGRGVLARTRARRAEAHQAIRQFARPRGPPTEDALSSVADSQFEQLMKRGKVVL